MMRIFTRSLLGIVAVLAGCLFCGYSLNLAGTRIYQVEECQNIFAARTLALGHPEAAAVPASLFLAPLVLLARDAAQSADLYASARLVALLVLWLNLALLTLATGAKLLSSRGLVAFLGAATMAPLWDFGFEVRSENLLLTGLLLTWCAVRVGSAGFPAYLVAGGLAVAMQSTAWNAIFYTLPLTAAILVCPPNRRLSRGKLALAWSSGALGMLAVICLIFSVIGLRGGFLHGIPLLWKPTGEGESMSSWRILGRLLGQTPLMLALLSAALLAVSSECRRLGKAALDWSGSIPEATLLIVSLTALIFNPHRQPSDLLIPSLCAYLLVFRYAGVIASEAWSVRLGRPLLVCLVVFAHLVPFGIATRRHWKWTNYQQEGLMLRAEQLTDAAKDTVYDEVGLVPTRRSSHIDLARLAETPHESLTPSEQPPTIVIRNERTEWLWQESHSLIREHYVALSDDFWVLGKLLPPGGGSFQIMRPGRYQITAKEASCILGTVERNPLGLILPPAKTNCVGTLDGKPITGKPVELTTGRHRIETASDCQPAVVWLGPHLNQLRPLPDADRLFVNWY